MTYAAKMYATDPPQDCSEYVTSEEELESIIDQETSITLPSEDQTTSEDEEEPASSPKRQRG